MVDPILKWAGGKRQLMPEIRRYLSGRGLPSEENSEIAKLEISSHYNIAANDDIVGIKLGELKSAAVGKQQFILPTPEQTKDKLAIVVGVGKGGSDELVKKIKNIEVNHDVSSLIFMHTCALPAGIGPSGYG